MRGAGKGRAARRGGRDWQEHAGRGRYDDGWDPENPDQDPGRDLRDMYEDLQDPAVDDYIWPEHVEREED